MWGHPRGDSVAADGHLAGLYRSAATYERPQASSVARSGARRGSVVNGMAFVRGNRRNYDDWAESGATGWGFDDALPAFRRLESFEDGASELRGGDGPIAVERATGSGNRVTHEFMSALSATTGVPFNDDYNGAEQRAWPHCSRASAPDGVTAPIAATCGMHRRICG